MFIAIAALFACALAAGFLHALVGAWGRDPRPALAVMALLMFATSLYLSGWRNYGASSLVAAAGAAELLLVAAIGWLAYGGVPRFDPFFYSWFIPTAIIVAAPWLAGMVVGRWRAAKSGRTHGSL